MVLMLISACQEKNSETMIYREISDNWTFQQVKGQHNGEATVPGTIHTDLLKNGAIDDPFYRVNEKDQQWIDKEDWVYQTNLFISTDEMARDNIYLVFEGLDTYADVYINDQLILEADNMFRTWEVDVKQFVSQGDNELRVYLHSPIKKGLALLEAANYAYPAINDQSENGGLGDKKVSIFTRKAGYHYGWDWGPRFVTSGLWRPVVLKSWNSHRIKDVFIQQPHVSASLAQLNALVEIEANKASKVELTVSDKSTGAVLAQKIVDVKHGLQSVSIPFEINKPKLWWSAGLGEPHLYNFEVIVKGGNNLSTKAVRTGLRSLKLVREKDAMGESFLFELNGVRVFAKGANYIPNDNFLPRVTVDDYKKVIADAVDANMNMLRVWGGGIYENDKFYELCDENGLLVWQDFMFACSMYPGNEAFLSKVKHEAIDNVKRLRNHPSIAVWCGNNEINAAWSHYSDGGWGWKEMYSSEQREEIQKAYLDLFHGILPEVVMSYTDGDDYWPSSPQAGFEPEKHAGYENTAGDMHYWGVWHGKHPFEDFDKYKARFMSEYGFQSFPDFETVKKYTIPEDYDIESEVMASHQRSGIGNLRIKEYMGWDYNVPADFEDFLYMSQVLQARGTKMAIEAHRRAMPYCMGTLYWQINDCWPVASWSSTDYYHKWKAMHYAVKRAYEPVIVSAFMNADKLEIKAVSDLLENKEAQLKLELIDFNGQALSDKLVDFNLLANTSSQIGQFDLNDLLKGADKAKSVLKMSVLTGKDVLASNLYYFVKPKEQNLPKATIETTFRNVDGTWHVDVKTNKLARDIYLNFPNKEVVFSDNYFDLLPGEKRTITLSGDTQFNETELQVMHLQQNQ